MGARQLWVAILLGAVLTPGCNPEVGFELFVDLRTDLVPMEEFQVLEVLLEAPGARSPIHEERTVTADELFIEGRRVAEFAELKKGRYRLIVRLRTEAGILVVERPASIELQGNRVVTMVITRDCRYLICDEPGLTACLQGECIPESCTPETPEACPAPTCSTGRDCAPPLADCAETFCAEGACLARARIPNRCTAGSYCDAEMGCRAEIDPPDANCTDGIHNGDEAAVDCGGSCPAGCPDGTVCHDSSACGSAFCNPIGVCSTPSCTDGYVSQDETGTDCGGSCPDRCPNGDGCSVHADCVSLYCNPFSACAPLSCSDEVRNGTETGIDCGGTCPACNGDGCIEQFDCASGYCTVARACAEPSCSDGFANGDEVGIDCGGSCVACEGFCTGITEIPVYECQALKALYGATGGPSWTTNTGWLTTTTPCSWHGITCDRGFVSRLDLQGNNLAGPVPPELGNLTELLDLLLQDNLLTGSIPPALGHIGHMDELALSANRLTGSIPPALGNLVRVRNLWLDGNQLSGSIPPELGNLTRLDWLYLHRNELSGSIPPELGNLPALTWLSLYDNQLTGSIPPELGNLTTLGILYLHGNELSGSIPPELGNLTRLTGLYLMANELDGPIPPELGNLTSLTGFFLYYNFLTGPIPPELGNLTKVTGLWLVGNRLTRVSPNTFDTLPAIEQLFLDGNLLDQASVDETLSQVYAARATYTNAAPAMTLHYSNSSPSGTATNPSITPGNGRSNSDWSWNGTCHKPRSGQAMAYALANDNCDEGFNPWTVDYNP